MMLMTGSKKRSTHRFYQKSGYNKIEKTAYIQRLKNKGNNYNEV